MMPGINNRKYDNIQTKKNRMELGRTKPGTTVQGQIVEHPE